MEETSEPNSPTSFSPSLKQKLKSTLCLPCPFRTRSNHHAHIPLTPTSHPKPTRTLVRTSSTGLLKSTRPKEYEDSDVLPLKPTTTTKDKRSSNNNNNDNNNNNVHSNNVPRMGGGRNTNHRRRRQSVSADFSYDALSYSLNFDDGSSGDVDIGFGSRDFSSRLPRSPPGEVFQV